MTDETAPPAALVVPVDVSTPLPASSLTVSLFIDEGDATGNTSLAAQAFLVQDVDVVVSGSTEQSTTNTDEFTYDGAGRMTARTVTVTNGGDPVWSLMFGDVQGSAQVVMGLNVDPAQASGFAAASVTDGIQRTAYTPFGARRDTEDLDIDRGWLGQVEDTDTGLTYLNARYYDPVLSRFLSPDPLMNPGDPRTLDAYRYAENNPVSYTDASGLRITATDRNHGSAVNNESKFWNTHKNLNPGTGTPKPKAPKRLPTPSTPAEPKPSTPNIGFGGIGGVPPIGSGDGESTPCGGPVSGASCANSGLQSGIDWITGWKDNGGFRKDGSYNTPKGTPGWVKSFMRRLFGSTGRQATTAISHLDILGTPLWAIGTIASGVDAYNHLEDLGVRDEMPLWDVALNVVGRTVTGSVFGAVFEGAAGAAALPMSVSGGLACGEAVSVCAVIIDISVMSAASIGGDMLGTYFWDNTNDARLEDWYGSGG